MSRIAAALAAASLATACVAAPLTAAAQQPPAPPMSPNAIQPETTISLNGHGEIAHAPDIAQINVGVSVDAETASTAMS